MKKDKLDKAVDKTSEVANLPVATHTANFEEYFGVNVDYYVLENGQRLISQRGMARAMGYQQPSGGAFQRAIQRQKYIDVELAQKIANPVKFLIRKDGTIVAHGYEATILIDICDAIVKAGDNKLLAKSQTPMFMQARIIIGASSKFGIINLGDRLANYDAGRAEYLELWKELIREEARTYEPEFPVEIFDMFYRLYNLEKQNYKTNHPQFFAHLIRRYVYTPLASSNGAILEHLEKKNPVVYRGNRKFRLHQFLNEIGVKALRQHLGQIIAIGKLSDTLPQFNMNFERVFGSQLHLPFEDDSLL